MATLLLGFEEPSESRLRFLPLSTLSAIFNKCEAGLRGSEIQNCRILRVGIQKKFTDEFRQTRLEGRGQNHLQRERRETAVFKFTIQVGSIVQSFTFTVQLEKIAVNCIHLTSYRARHPVEYFPTWQRSLRTGEDFGTSQFKKRTLILKQYFFSYRAIEVDGM